MPPCVRAVGSPSLEVFYLCLQKLQLRTQRTRFLVQVDDCLSFSVSTK